MKTKELIKEEFFNLYNRICENKESEDFSHDKNFITYGLGNFDKTKFKKIQNPNIFRQGGFGKPVGGLWASPSDSEYGWFEFIESDAKEMKNRLENNIQFTINPNANILVLNTVDDICEYIPNKGYMIKLPITLLSLTGEYVIDYEKLIEMGYDGMYVSSEVAYLGRDCPIYLNKAKKEIEFRMPTFDLESILIFNSDIIENVRYNEDDGKRDRFEKITPFDWTEYEREKEEEWKKFNK